MSEERFTQKVTIKLSSVQQYILDPILSSMCDGESMIAQVYSDGLRIKVLDPDTSKRVSIAIGTSAPAEKRSSAFD